MVKYDTGMHKYDPDRISESYKIALKQYKKLKREYKHIVEDKKEMEDRKFRYYKFEQSNEKVSDVTAKVSASLDQDVLAFKKPLREKEEEMDDAHCEIERLVWKKDFFFDSNATKRKEMELTRMET